MAPDPFFFPKIQFFHLDDNQSNSRVYYHRKRLIRVQVAELVSISWNFDTITIQARSCDQKGGPK